MNDYKYAQKKANARIARSSTIALMAFVEAVGGTFPAYIADFFKKLIDQDMGLRLVTKRAFKLEATRGLIRWLLAPGKTREHSYPVVAASLLGRLLREKYRVAFLGDLAEQYEAIKEDVGQRAADSWFRKQVARAILPLLWCRIRGYCKALVKRLSR